MANRQRQFPGEVICVWQMTLSVRRQLPFPLNTRRVSKVRLGSLRLRTLGNPALLRFCVFGAAFLLTRGLERRCGGRFAAPGRQDAEPECCDRDKQQRLHFSNFSFSCRDAVWDKQTPRPCKKGRRRGVKTRYGAEKVSPPARVDIHPMMVNESVVVVPAVAPTTVKFPTTWLPAA